MTASRLLILLTAFATFAVKAEVTQCLATDPGSWPPVSKPYILLIADTSASMIATIGSTDSCGYGSDRRAHQRCAINRILKAYAGQVEFGLMNFAFKQASCTATCFTDCTYSDYPSNSGGVGCGPESAEAPTSPNRRGGFLQVPIRADNQTPPAADSFPNLNAWTDNSCSGNTELFASGSSPLNGALRDAFRYLSNQWVAQDNSITYGSPLGAIAGEERACRTLRVVMFADSGDNCDNVGDAADAAADLVTGFSRGGVTFSVRTHVLDLTASGGELNGIASAGQTTTAVPAVNETAMYTALNDIVLATLSAEVGDNQDNNCNGCTDEGMPHFANLNPVCCAWVTPAQRSTCLVNFQASISPANPKGTRSLLPCTNGANAVDPTRWLVYDPGETCNNSDDNGDGQVDEGLQKCGNPLHCPATEVCDAEDNDCDGLIDEGGVCGICTPSPEICDGCDNDCDSVADNGAPSGTCGLTSPPNCVGTLACRPAQPVGMPGACVSGGGFASCSNMPLAESCDGIDNSCNGQIDEGLSASNCEPAGTPSGLIYGGSSQCRRGQQFCGQTTCHSFIGPTPEVSDGIDNDCDGAIDNGIDAMFKNGFE
ncbi:MopE-related protein [Ahniella affigens]|nr:MopE-related protein [Ahniella affigens]